MFCIVEFLQEFVMVVMYWYVPQRGVRDVADGVALVAFVDQERHTRVVQVVTGSDDLLHIYDEHTFMSQAVADRYLREVVGASLPEHPSVTNETLTDPLSEAVFAALRCYEEYPRLRKPPHECWGAYLVRNWPEHVVFAYVDRQGSHHFASFVDFPSMQRFFLETHIHQVPRENLAILLVGDEKLPSKERAPVRIFSGRVAWVLAEGIRILSTVHDVPLS